MARIFILLAFLFGLPALLGAQQTVYTNFDALVWSDEFDAATSDLWLQTTNADEIYIIQSGEYILFRKDTKDYGLVFPNEKLAFSAHKAEFSLRLDDDNDKSASAGVVVMAQEDGKGAFLIEINGKRQYRVAKYNGYVFKTIEGWKKNKSINGRGKANTISITMEDKRYDLYINGELITSFSEVTYKSGKIGLYVGPDSKVNVDFVHVYVTANEKDNILRGLKKQQQEKDNPVLTEVIKKLREQMVQLEIERDSLRVVVDQLKAEQKKGGNNTTPPSTQKLKTENAELKAEVERLRKENNKLWEENSKLRDFKETIINSDNGDIIITLTKAIETEKERIEILAAENEKLNEEIRQLKERLKN